MSIAKASRILSHNLFGSCIFQFDNTSSYYSNFQVISQSVFDAGSSSRLKRYGMEFTVWVTKHANDTTMRELGQSVLEVEMVSGMGCFYLLQS